MMKCEKVIIYGAGQSAKEFLEQMSFYEDLIEVLAVTDSNEELWGSILFQYRVISPREAYQLPYEKFIITSGKYFEEISKIILNETRVSDCQIENIYYVAKRKLSARYREHADKTDVLEYINTHPLGIFNYSYVDNYKDISIDVYYDNDAELFYVIHKEHKMYMARRLNTRDKVKAYYRSLCIEQDINSPHRYLDENFHVDEQDVVLDIGAAEGYFTLEVIEKVKRVYLLETDKEWTEALGYTFKDYKSKVIVINSFVSDYVGFNTTTLDEIIEEKVDFIKLDVEGCEYAVLTGGKDIMKRNKHMKCAVCTYHNDNDEIILKDLMEGWGFHTYFSNGYMWFPYSMQQIYIQPTLRRGVLRCEK